MTRRDRIAMIRAALGLLHVRIIICLIALGGISAAGMIINSHH